jgi:hypothetical protein
MTPASLARPIIFALAPRSEVFVGGVDALAENGVLDESKVGGQNFSVDFVYDRDRVLGVRGEGADLAPVAPLALLLKILEMLVQCLWTLFTR